MCPMCRRPLPKKGRGYIVGWPKSFLICRDCWKGWVIRNADPSKAIRGAVRLDGTLTITY